jgi:CRISPR system Cascade subunit CasE
MHAQGHDEGRVLHHLLVETFGKVSVPDTGETPLQKAAFQPFRVMASGRTASLYGYSDPLPDDMRATAQTFATPESLALLPLDRMDAKPMPEVWRQGQLLGFDLRTPPVVRLKFALPATRDHMGEIQRPWEAGAEVDAFLAHVLRTAPQGDPATQEASREPLYCDWLAARLAPAADLLADTRLVRFRRIRISREARREVPEAVFHGTLRITNPAAFARLLARGVGRHCAYGFGLVLLRPPGTAAMER